MTHEKSERSPEAARAFELERSQFAELFKGQDLSPGAVVTLRIDVADGRSAEKRIVITTDDPAGDIARAVLEQDGVSES